MPALFLRLRGILSAVLALGGGTLGAQAYLWDTFGGARIQASLGLPGGVQSLGENTRGHVGLGTGIFMGVRASDRNAIRVSLDYVGTEVATWYYFFPNRADSIEYKDIWRSLRLSVEHEFTLDGPRRIYALWGGGVEESWVNRTEGDLLELTLLAVAWTKGATEGSARYSTKSTALDGVHPFASLGLGWRVRSSRRSWGDVELRYLVGPYLRYRATGLRTQAEGPTETALGHRLVLSWALRLGE